jgi:O-methyltransferase domain
MKQLEDSQLETFDTEYVNEQRWKIIKAQIDKDFPSGDFNFLDVGGGNGVFADRLLEYYPNSKGTVLDNAQVLLDKNQINLRKTIICDSVENLNSIETKYDLICFNWLLHHLVSNSYSETRNNMSTAINAVIPLLTPHGKVSIFENMYNGLAIDGLPSQIIFTLTSSKAIAGLIKKMGANTAGVGVCFLSQKQWIETISNTGLKLLKYTDDEKWPIPTKWRVFLHIGNIRCGHFWLTNSEL